MLCLTLILLLLADGDAAQTETPPPPGCNLTAPDNFSTLFETSQGAFSIAVTRSWAPYGADRFYSATICKQYSTDYFFRVITDFVVQFGLSGIPSQDAEWQDATIPDDPVTQSNTFGMVSFASAGPDTRTTQIFINLADNSQLDAQGFAPFGFVSEVDMDVVLKLYAGYGEESDKQELILKEGNEFLQKNYPLLDYVTSASIATSEGEGRRPVFDLA